MRVRLDLVRDEPFTWHETLEVSPQTLDHPELLGLGPVSCRGRLVYANPGFVFEAELDYEQTLTCFRCLNPTPEAVTSKMELVVLVDSDRQRRRGEDMAELELYKDDLNVVFLDEEVLETEPLLVEQLQLSFPMKPLCKPDCKGLCAVCGADLNLGPCQCKKEVEEPRWSALRALRDRLSLQGHENG